MTEAEFMASENPAEMLTWLMCGPVPSDRKLRLFACACCLMRGTAAKVVEAYEKDGAPIDEMERQRWTDQQWAMAWTEHGMKKPTMGQRAAILRDLIGSPFRPITLPKGPPAQCPRCGGDGWVATPDGLHASRAACKVCDGKGTLNLFGPCPWITDAVLLLAGRAYEDRNADGSLDALTLLAVADALEEAGCPAEVQCPCVEPWDNSILTVPGGRVGRYVGGVTVLKRCPGCGETGIATHPLLAHLRSPGPHWRGCWAVDLLPGKE